MQFGNSHDSPDAFSPLESFFSASHMMKIMSLKDVMYVLTTVNVYPSVTRFCNV